MRFTHHPGQRHTEDGPLGNGIPYANLAMELNGGQLAFPQPGEIEISDEFDGSVVALIFKEIR